MKLLVVWAIVIQVSAYGYEAKVHPQHVKDRFVFNSVEACARHVTKNWRDIIGGVPIKPQWIDCEPMTVRR